ncbi:SLC13 family permease [Thermaerobacter composti]|uniref:SLC13 family permease n=1 Tax=Thermaerobacter composti TaxID=554949 RepID=A0ABZ0QSJ3_9FIRM|nr:SLC13 family permease [Thermaerobacter composti]WPD19719.1 SLC13 family permease [Thermaerobacter composti]
MGLSWQAWITLGVVTLIFLALLREWARPEVIMMGGLVVLMATGVLPPEQALQGFASPALFTIAALLIITAGIQRTDALRIVHRWLTFSGDRVHEGQVLGRILPVTALLASFINNTPLVAFWIPILQDLAERYGLALSRMLLPLNYATIVGGMITLVGTSTNLVASQVLEQHGLPPFGLFDLTPVGLPVAVVAVAFLLLVGHRLLPARSSSNDAEETEAFQFELRVRPGGGLGGKTVREAGLRALGRAYLAHIQRDGEVLGPVGPEDRLQDGDVLTFVGDPAMMDRLLRRPGLERVMTSRRTGSAGPPAVLPLYEAVVSDTSVLVGRSLKEVRFRERFGGVVVAIRRRGERIDGGLGTVPLKVGDVLLIEAPPGFDHRWKNGGEFYLVVRRDRPYASVPERGPVALLWLAAAVAGHLALDLPLVVTTMIAAGGMVMTRCLEYEHLRHVVRPGLLVTIAAGLGIAQAIESSGLAATIGRGVQMVGYSTGLLGLLVALYIATVLVTELVTNAAAVAFMMPIALNLAKSVGLDPRPLAVLVTIGASAGFISPIGYQTNLMVMGIGRYRVQDFVRVGLPLSLLVGVTAISVVLWQVGN